jgi:hypothetical protein
MNSTAVKAFITLAGQKVGRDYRTLTKEERTLGAQLLLSEVLEYVIDGLGVTPEVNGVKITDADGVTYGVAEGRETDPLEMIDGLADVAYTMYWNALSFGVKLEEAFALVCANNLEKFVKLVEWQGAMPAHGTALTADVWHCHKGVTWPAEVSAVTVIEVDGTKYAVGKDARGKVRKPSTYVSVDLTPLV